ncbi:MAG: hypothetical protein M5U01_36010 [Ardenticatenaceae bacterium]|nr:hypothetical protein [Ardenticatenaceae bacterium]HBY97563.1 hypothetical protein [Chloroflexota bacterium]
MTEQRFQRYWYTGLAIVVAIIATVAALLLTIIGTARSILSNAERTLAIARQIVDNTQPIWKLEQTNRVAAELAEEARSIKQHATQIADTLEAP